MASEAPACHGHTAGGFGSAGLQTMAQPAVSVLALVDYTALNELITLLREAQTAFDLGLEDLVMVLTIMIGNVQRWHRATQPSDMISLIPMSQSAVSRATGLARETTRRRVQRLHQRGLVALDRRGAVTLDPHFARSFIGHRALRRLLALTDQGGMTR